MTDNLQPQERVRAMRAVRSRNTAPEVQLRKALHGLGVRFRLHRADLPGSPDVVFPRYRAVVFVHGCFWHGHRGCTKAKLPATRTAYWLAKRERNQRRDAAAIRALHAKGWRVKVIWTCRLQDPLAIARAIEHWLKRQSR